MTPHLCHVFSTFGAGGPEVRTALLIDAAGDEFRHTVVSLSGDLAGRDRVGRRDGVAFLAAPRPGGRAASPLALARLLRALRPDLTLTYGWGGTDAVLGARLCGLRRVIHAEDGFLPDEAARQKPARLLARRVVLRAPARVVVPSRTLARIAAGRWWLPRRKVRYIPNGVDAARFAPGPPEQVAAARRRRGCPEAGVVVGTVGHLRPEKNHARLLRGFAAVAPGRDAALLIVGDGPLRPELERLARDLGIADRVRFAGAVADPADCYRAMDVFAITSDTEQMPIAALEAMAAGLPVAGTDVGDVAAMVAPANRPLVVPAADEPAFAAALARLVDDADARARLGRANRQTCLSQYDQAVMIRTYLDLYREVLGSGRRADGTRRDG